MHTRLWTLTALGLSLAACDPYAGPGGSFDGMAGEGEADSAQGDQSGSGDAGDGYSSAVLDTLAWALFDMGDSLYDTTVILDDFRWDCEGCIPSEVDDCGIIIQ